MTGSPDVVEARMRRVGVGELRKMNAIYLRVLDEPLEICSKNQPVSVLFPYAQYLELQAKFMELRKLADRKEEQEK